MKEIIALIKARMSVLGYLAAFDSTLLLSSRLSIGPLLFILATIAVYSISLANYTLSDLLDIEEDRLNNPNRPIASGKVSKRTALCFIIALLILSLLIGLYINVKFVIFIALSFLLALIYSAPKVRAKSRWWSKMLVAGLGSFIAPFTVSSIVSPSSTVFLMSLIFMLWGLFSLNLGDVLDYEGDKKSGVITFAVFYGKNKAITLLKMLLIAQLIAEVMLTLSVNLLNFEYMCLAGAFFIYFLKGLLELETTKDQKYVGKKLKKMTRISVIALQLVTLSLLV